MKKVIAMNGRGEQMDDLIRRQDAITAYCEHECGIKGMTRENCGAIDCGTIFDDIPPVQPTLYGYNIEHLEMIARVLQKEDLPPERIVEVLTDIGRIVAIVKDEFEETLRKAVEKYYDMDKSDKPETA